MTNHEINTIASMLTDDPDLFLEDMAGNLSNPAGQVQNLDTSDIDQNPMDMENPDSALDDQVKAQQEMEEEQEKEKQKLLKPQFDKLNTTMAGLQNGVMQGKQAAGTNATQFSNLDRSMTDLNALIGNLTKQI